MENSFFKTRHVGESMWSIAGAANDLMYLVEGQEKALVVDTGMGIGDLAAVVRSLTDKPLIVVNTHGHPDHAGGNPNFDEVWLHPEDGAIRVEMCTDAYRLNDLKAMHGEGTSEYRRLSRALVRYRPYAVRPLQAGQVFDLGGRRFEVLELPGHTPGSVCLLNSQEKILFSGDSIIETPVWLYLKHSLSVQVYHASLLKIKERENELESVFPGHSPYPVGRQHLHDLIACSQKIMDNPSEGVLTRTFAGEGLLRPYGKVSIIYDPTKIW